MATFRDTKTRSFTPEKIGRWFVGVGRRHPVTMRKASFKTLSMRRECAMRHQTGAQYSAVEQTKDRAAVRSDLVPSLLPKLASRLRSVTQVASFFAQCLEMVSVRE